MEWPAHLLLVRGGGVSFALRGCLAKQWVMGIVPCFDPI